MTDTGNIRVKKDLKALMYKLSYLIPYIIFKILFVIVNSRQDPVPYDFTMALDGMIPFIKYFIIPYVYWYFYLFIWIIFLAVKDYKIYFRLLAAIYLSETVAIITYIFIPSTTQRPVITENDFFSNIIGMLYKIDPHRNCLPSIHILETVLISLFLLQYSKKAGMKIYVWISAVMICLSTLFIKQHVVLDVIVSLILSFAVYFIVTCKRIVNNKKVKKILHFLIPDRIRHN